MYNEADTRAKLIDPKLHECGWTEEKIQRNITIAPGKLLDEKGKRKKGANDAKRKVAVVHMPKEALPVAGESIRNERIRLLIDGLKDAGCTTHPIEVEDYSASNAWSVIEQCPNADGYVCLSDEIAIGVKHLFWARGEKAADRILGFDRLGNPRAELVKESLAR